jgi:hypothetical protein
VEDQDYRVMTEANNAHLAAYLLHVLARAKERQLAPTMEDGELLNQLRAELLTSWMGAREVAVHALTPEPDGLPDDQPFGRQLDEYGRFREFHGERDPRAHAEWVEQMVSQIDLLRDTPWSQIGNTRREDISKGLEPLLRWMSSSQSTLLPRRPAPTPA